MMKSRLCLMSLVSTISAAGWTARVAAQDGPLPATPAPPGLEALRRVVRPGPPPPSPSVRELIEIVRRRPGGLQLLERARRGGAHIDASISSIGYDGFTTLGNHAGPRLSSVDPESNPVASAQTTLKGTRNAPSAYVAGLGSLYAGAYYPLYATTDLNLWGPLDYRTWAATYSPAGGAYDAKSFVQFSLSVQSTGWYLINVVASPAVSAEMRRYSASPAGYVLIQTFPAPATTGYNSYPVLLNLAAGSHYFSWVTLATFPYNAYVSEVSITKL
jgi:hypothetical protein